MYSLAVSLFVIKTLVKQLFLLVCLYELWIIKFLKLSQATTLYCFTVGSLTRVYSCKWPALVTTTFAISRGGFLQDHRLYSVWLFPKSLCYNLKSWVTILSLWPAFRFVENCKLTLNVGSLIFPRRLQDFGDPKLPRLSPNSGRTLLSYLNQFWSWYVLKLFSSMPVFKGQTKIYS